MSKSVLAFKIFGASSLTLGSVVGIGYGVNSLIQSNQKSLLKKLTDEFNNQSLINASSETVASAGTFVIAQGLMSNDIDIKNKLNTDQNNKNYKCKIGSQTNNEDAACVVKSVFPLADNKKHINLTALKALEGSDVKVGDLSASNSYFKIKLNDTLFDALSWDDSKTIDIYLTGTDSKKIGSLRPIFGVKNTDIKGKTLFSLGKINSFKNTNTPVTDVDNISYDETKTTCNFTSTPSEIPCKINKFVENDSAAQTTFSSLNFLGSVEETKTIKKDKYYLFQFSSASNKKEKTDFKESGDATIATTVKVVGSGAAATINKLEVTNLTPVFVIGDNKNQTILLSADIS